MIKYLLSISLISIVLLFSGCGDDEGEKRLATQQNLDSGNYAGVIAELDNRAVKVDSDNAALAAAYMGNAGMSIPQVIDIVSLTADEGDKFANFINSISKRSSISAYRDVGRATGYYKAVIGDICKINLIDSLSDYEKDACLFIGLSYISRVAVMVDMMMENVSAISENGVEDKKLKASVCALQYSLSGSRETYVASECRGNITEYPDVRFTQNEMVYTPLVVSLDKDYHYLLTDLVAQTGTKVVVAAKGYCSAEDFSTRYIPQMGEQYIKPSNYYACPANESKDITVVDTLADIFNEGLEAVGVSDHTDIKESIEKFKAEIKDSLDSTKIVQQEMIDYLNRKNN
ncbi:MAG: hypothetical protein U9N33_03360 [Campylobacterota bacterium]|nr:hypothetical protein [Campylobacterota bacterium]